VAILDTRTETAYAGPMTKITALFNRAAAWVIPKVLAPHRKAVVAFVVPIVVANLARFVPDVQVSASLVEQIVGSAIISLITWATVNGPK
jgi:hypothetical protein